MITLSDQGVYLVGGTEIVPADAAPQYDREAARKGTIAWGGRCAAI